MKSSRKTPPKALTEMELREIFDAKSQDFGIKPTEKLFQRFLKHRGNQARLKVFEMENSSLGPKAASVLAKVAMNHQNFRILNFAGNSFGNEGAIQFSEFIRLTKTVVSIDLSSNLFTDVGFQSIMRAMNENNSIVDLYIGSSSGVARNTIGIHGISELSKMLMTNRILSLIDLSMTEISSENIEPLAFGLMNNHTLQTLNLSNNNLRSKGAIIIINACKDSSLHELNISNNHITDDVSPHFASFLIENKTLKQLNLSGNNLTQKFTSSISVSLASADCYIKELNLSRNPLGNRGISALAHAMSSNRTLTKLNISACKIQTAGFIEFCNELVHNTSLQSLYVHHNAIRDAGASRLAYVIQDHPTLREIDIELCEIGDSGARDFFAAATDSLTLEKISLKNNLIRDGICIQKAIEKNTKLRYVNIEYNDIDFKIYTEIQRSVALNKKAQIENKNTLSKEEENIINAGYDQELIFVREYIKEERTNIEDLKKELEKTEHDAEVALNSRNNTIANLEQKLDDISNEVNNAINDLRNERLNLEKQNQEIEQEVANINGRLSHETEAFRLDCRNLSNINSKIEEMEETSTKELAELDEKLKNVKDLYRDNRRMLESAFQFAKMTISSKNIQINDEHNTQNDKNGTKSPAKGKGRKGKSKSRAKSSASKKLNKESTEINSSKKLNSSSRMSEKTSAESAKKSSAAKSGKSSNKNSSKASSVLSKKAPKMSKKNVNQNDETDESKSNKPLEEAPAAAAAPSLLAESGIQPESK
ncbi:hypothetical protein TRFO_40913 [Tritrichomonas foetus]|uniref:Leucine Rich Repeat family protein n=1 Tax=Tritrichomonas foetus TaxID=1144522 RepID=A0A1J4IZM0_9EUKA|nr:hypothetical protein TRFO_40913 [Tritrichomonas foetus]|eukprot:OHS92792.1 hypothetical protein TRFO_40913 [Tritrichomonas foetus]